MNRSAVPYPRRRDGLVCEELDDEAILYDRTFNTTYRLNETGYFIFKACDGSATIQDIAGLVSETYDVDIQTAGADVRSTVALMQDEGLLSRPGEV